jgi:TatD-related deoxyribonuclease
VIVFDNHLHLREEGRFLDAIKDFIKAGGTHFVLCQLPMINLVLKEKSYKSCYQKTIEIADIIRSKIDIGVFITVGPYPADFLKISEKFGYESAVSIMKKGIDEAAELCEEKKAIGIGEIGRPHFIVNSKVIAYSNEIMFYGMQKAKDVDVPVVLHTESTTPKQCKELRDLGKKAGLKPEKIIKHFSPPLIREDENFGLMPSVLASEKNIYVAITKGTRFLMETDYIDDPRRPGAVLGPKTVPKRTFDMIEKGLLTEKQAFDIHKNNPEKTYNIEL